MTARGPAALVGPVAVVAAIVVAFVVFIDPMRQVETTAAADLLRLFGVPAGAVAVLPGASVAVYPRGQLPFVAVVTPACSALSSLLAVSFLAAFVPRAPCGRRLAAVACALGCVLVGNILRIAASLGVGLVSGTSSLVLFHDWVGSMFAFAYTLGGYLLMIALLLPRHDRQPVVEMGSHAA